MPKPDHANAPNPSTNYADQLLLEHRFSETEFSTGALKMETIRFTSTGTLLSPTCALTLLLLLVKLI